MTENVIILLVFEPDVDDSEEEYKTIYGEYKNLVGIES